MTDEFDDKAAQSSKTRSSGTPLGTADHDEWLDEGEALLADIEGPEALREARISAQPNRLAELARFSPVFIAPGFRFATWHHPPQDEAGRIVCCQLSPDAEAFLAGAYDFGWVTPFNWVEWGESKEGKLLLAGPKAVAKATPQQLAKLLTRFIRADRFVEGTLLAAFEDGFLTAIVQRAEKLSRPRQNHAISEPFMRSLKCGVLSLLLRRVQEDDTLMLALRGHYINIYYRGGSLFRVTAIPPPKTSPNAESYSFEFDRKFNVGYSMPLLPDFPLKVTDHQSAADLVAIVPMLKYVMDRFFACNHHEEREFQQLVARENNRSAIAHETDYFIVDIEIADIRRNARYDMLAVRWRDHKKAGTGFLVPALINHAKGSAPPRRSIDRDAKAEIIFLLANYNPASIRLETFLKEDRSTFEPTNFDLLFFVSCFAGYGMHRASMLKFGEFKSEVARLHEFAKRKPH